MGIGDVNALPVNRGRRWRVHQTLESGLGHDRLSVIVNTGILVLVCVNIVLVALGTVPAFAAEHRAVMQLVALVSALVFGAEYAARLWAAVDLPYLADFGPLRARLNYALRPLPMADLVAAVAAVLAVAFDDVAGVAVARLACFLKVARYSPALHSLGRVVAAERGTLFGALLVMLGLLLVAGSGLYVLERGVQPERFGTLPDALWWALVTLATVGYGDVVPVTAAGKVFTMIVILSGVGVFAIPVGIIVNGFSQELSRRDFMVTWGLVARVPVFSGLDAATIAQIMDLLQSHVYEAGEEIVRSGERADSMFFIASGEVVVAADNGDVRLGQGEFFGEMALLEHRLRGHDVTACTRCRLLVLKREDFERLTRGHPEVLARVRETAVRRGIATGQRTERD